MTTITTNRRYPEHGCAHMAASTIVATRQRPKHGRHQLTIIAANRRGPKHTPNNPQQLSPTEAVQITEMSHAMAQPMHATIISKTWASTTTNTCHQPAMCKNMGANNCKQPPSTDTVPSTPVERNQQLPSTGDIHRTGVATSDDSTFAQNRRCRK